MEKEKNKIHRLRFAAKDRAVLDLIANGKKKVETRAGTVKYMRIKEGDTLMLCCGTYHLMKTVQKVTHVKSISALLKKYTPSVINPGAKTIEDMEKMYYAYPGYKEKIKQYGILAFELS